MTAETCSRVADDSRGPVQAPRRALPWVEESRRDQPLALPLLGGAPVGKVEVGLDPLVAHRQHRFLETALAAAVAGSTIAAPAAGAGATGEEHGLARKRLRQADEQHGEEKHAS